MSNARSICFGRFLIDLPEGIQVTLAGQQSEFMFGPIMTEFFNSDTKGFSTRMKKREEELKAMKSANDRTLLESIALDIDGQIFTTSKNNFGRINFGFEAHKVDQNILFSMQEKGFREDVFRKEVLVDLQKSLLPNLRFRNPEEIPAEPGFCIKDGFVANDGGKRIFEEARIQLNFKEWPDVWFTVYSQTVAKEGEKALLQRMADNPIPPGMAALISQIKTLRKGKHAVGNLAGEEALDVLPHESGFKVHEFTWEMLGALRDPFKPTLHAEFSTGHIPGSSQRTRPSITDEQAIKLFDSLVNSIRLRPTGPAKVSAAEPPPLLPLGEVVSTGAACPQTGWWRCVESTLPMRGGRKQFFHAGDAMPHALLLAEPTVWQKLKGEQLTHKVSTVWTLVDYEARPVAAAPAAEATTPPADDKPAPADES